MAVLFYYRVKNRLESLTTSLIAWKQFENGLIEFKEVLGKDTGALKRLTGALELGSDMITNNLAHDVKEVAMRLSEKMDNQNTMATASGQQVSGRYFKVSDLFRWEKIWPPVVLSALVIRLVRDERKSIII